MMLTMIMLLCAVYVVSQPLNINLCSSMVLLCLQHQFEQLFCSTCQHSHSESSDELCIWNIHFSVLCSCSNLTLLSTPSSITYMNGVPVTLFNAPLTTVGSNIVNRTIYFASPGWLFPQRNAAMSPRGHRRYGH